MIKEFKIFESKQVGVIYHFTFIYNLYKILNEREPSLRPIGDHISCTRNFNMKSNELKLEKQCCRITLDGNKISQKYRIIPYFDMRNPDTEEREEKIIINDKLFINGRLDLKKYCIRIDILNNPPIIEDDSSKNPINTYTFEPNQYLNKQQDISFGYELLKNQITSLNSPLPIFFVDKMNPVKI